MLFISYSTILSNLKNTFFKKKKIFFVLLILTIFLFKYSFLDSSIYIEHIQKKIIILFNIFNMLHPFFIFLLSFTFLTLDLENL